ncbi:MAG: pyrroline-5-carboxylate reductase [Alphaproteobacteria bacterium]|jgi:pyrroline-5-carboxylate reductase|nr:pyrroline-5-carboxylate reductase [Alphaproteobacteria bacterium]
MKQPSLSQRTFKFSGQILLVGAGKMGGALLESWLGLGLDPKNVAVIEPHPSNDIKAMAARGLRLNPSRNEIGTAGAMVIALKPQVAAEAVPKLAAMLGPSTIVVSIMAGKTLGFLERALPNAAIVRAMPNTPAAIGRGITVAVPNKRVMPAQRDLAHQLLAATGAVEWVADESLMDAVTAVSGSGPAYVFLLVESLTRAAIAAGLPPELAAKLARETVTGSGELLHRSAVDPATLRQNVTSPGGTTAAALEILMAADGLDPLLKKAIAAAAKRSRELAG